MAIETYQQRIGVTAGRELTRPQLPGFSDEGGRAIAGLGASFAEEMFKRDQEKVEQAAIRDAGSAAIVKDENGNYVAPKPPPGGGRNYVQLFEKLTLERQANLSVKDEEIELNRLHAEFKVKGDPEGFLEAARARLEARLEAADPRVRPFLESRFATELSERQRELVGYVAMRDVRNLAQGEKDQAEYIGKQIISIISQPGDAEEKKKRVAPLLQEFGNRLQNLVNIGEMNKDSADALLGELTLTGEEAGRKVASLERAMEKTSPLMQFSENQLFAIGRTASGVDDPNAPEGYRLQDFDGMERVDRNQVGAQAEQIARDLRTRREDAEREQRKREEEERRHQQLIQATQKAAADMIYAFDPEQKVVLNQAFDSLFPNGGDFVKALSDPETKGRTHDLIRDFVAQYGMLPDKAVSYMENYVLSDQAPAVAELAMLIRNTDTQNGVSMGYKLIKQLSPRTQAAVELAERMRRTSVPQAVQMERIDAVLKGRARTKEEVYQGFGGLKVYNEAKQKRIEERLGIPPHQIPRALSEDYDTAMLWNLDIAGGDAREASMITVQQVMAGWVKSKAVGPKPIFRGGAAPRHIATAMQHMTAGDLDRALIRKGPKTQYLSFGNGTAQLEPLEIAPHDGKERYVVHVYDQSGRNEIGNYMIDDINANIARVANERGAQHRAAQQAEIARVRANRNKPTRVPTPRIDMRNAK